MKDKDMECKIVEELLPIYMENLTEQTVGEYVREHLEKCGKCRETYSQMKADISIRFANETPKCDKVILRYINSIKVWYLLCPAIALLLYLLDVPMALRLYEGGIFLFSFACILSEVYHRGSWWDQECIDLQVESREGAKRKWGAFYIRPFLFAVPSILVLLILNLPRFIRFFS